MFAGGAGSSGVMNTVDILGTNGTFTPGPPMLTARSNAACALLPDGRIFVSGGNDGVNALSSAEYFTPSTGAWTSAGSMNTARYGHTATVTQMGAVILAGGQTGNGVTSQFEVFRPASNQFTVLGNLSSARTSYAITQYDKIHTLIAGGSDGQNTLSTIDVFDSTTNAITAAGSMLASRTSFTAVTLTNGNVMFIGGFDPNGKALNSTEIYNPKTQVSVAGPTLNTARANHSAFTLPGNGSVVVFGGTDGQNTFSSSEVYNPAAGKFSNSMPMTAARNGAATAMMRGGFLVVGGGQNASGYLNTTETYAFATVGTDKPDYSPGSVATFTGNGWKPGESVALAVTSFTGNPPTSEFTGTVVADGTGAIHFAGFNVDKSHLGMKFLLTATGSQSQAITTFTDGDNTTVGLNSAFPNPPSSIDYGQAVTVNLLVLDSGGANGNPGTGDGSVYAYDNNLSLGVGSSQSPNAVPNQSPNTASVALTGNTVAITINPYDPSTILSPGFNNLVFQFSSTNPDWSDSNFYSVPIQVEPDNTLTSMTSGNQNIPFGASATLTATVQAQGSTSPNLPAYSVAPNGNLTFSDGNAPPQTCAGAITATAVSTSTWTCHTAASLPVGTYTFEANYNGTTNVWADSQSQNGTIVAVTAVNTTTTITPNLQSPQIYPATMTLTATVTAASGGTIPAGSVNFLDGTNNLCGTSYTLSNTGVATSCQFVLTAGDHSLTAAYQPSPSNWITSTSGVTAMHINPAPTAVVLTPAQNTTVVNAGGTVTLTATVSCNGSVSCSPIATPPATPPGGSIQFMDSVNNAAPVTLNTIALANLGTTGNSAATYTTPALVGGQHVFSATYVPPSGPTPPDNWQANTSNSLTYTVTGIEPTFSLQITPTPQVNVSPTAFQALSIQANAIPQGGFYPTGTIQLVLGTAFTSSQVALNNGQATFSVPNGLPVGTYAISINYSPLSTEINFVGPVAQSVSPSSLVVVKTPTTVTVTSSQTSPMIYGTQVTFTATVTPTGVPGTPGGAVQFYDNGVAIGGPAATANGVATLTSGGSGIALLGSGLAGVTHPITAIFTDSDNNYSNSPTSTAFNLTVNQATTTTTISASPTTVNLGGQITYSVSVQGTPAGAGNPTGTVAVTDVAASAPVTGCAITLSNANPATGSCQVTYNGTAPMTGGTHSISGAFASSSQNVAGSTVAQPVTVTVNPSTTTISALATTLGSPTYTPANSESYYNGGVNPTLTVTFAFGNTSGNPAPANNFQVYDGGQLIGNFLGTSVSPYQFSLPLTLTPGSHTFQVKYPSGDPNYSSTSSSTLAFTVNKFTDTVSPNFTVTSAGSPATYGNPVSLGGSINNAGGGSATPTGTLTFTFGTTTLGTCNLNSGGSCPLPITSAALTAGTGNPLQPDTINIAYNGDSNYASATGSGTLYIGKATVTGTITTSPASSANFAVPVTITVNYANTGAGNVGTPTGTAAVYDGSMSNQIGTITLNNGTGTLTTSSLTPGNHTLFALYGGDGNFNAVTSSIATTVALTINPGNTSVTVTPSANPVSLNTTVTYNIAAQGGPSGPTGTVTLSDSISGSAVVIAGCSVLALVPAASGNISTTSCNVSYNSSDQIHGAGSHPIVATYTQTNGSTNWGLTPVQSPTVTEVVGQTAPTISIPTVSSGLATNNYGSPLTFSVTLTPGSPSPAYAASTVQFYDNGAPMGAPASVVSGVATSSSQVLAGGQQSITAQFIGDSNYPASQLSPKLVITIAKVAPTVTVGAPISLTSPYYGMIGTPGNPIVVTVAIPNGNSGVTPTGSVSLMAGNTLLATVPLASNGIGTFNSGIQLPASLTVNGSPYSLYATYGGDGNWATANSSSQNGTLTINAAPAPVTVTANPTSSVFGQSVTLTATFNGPGNAVAGNIAFQNGSSNITGCGNVVFTNNVATCTTTILPVGNDTISVTSLSGDPNHTLGTVTPAMVAVGLDSTTTTLSSTPNPSVPGQAINFTAVITVPAPGNQTNSLNGTVSFTYGTTQSISGCTNLPLATHSSPAQVICQVPASTPPFTISGPYLITATYTPGNGDNNSGSSASLTQNVGQPAPTFTNISSSANPSVYGQSVTITATFTVPGTTTANGTIQFYDAYPNTLGGVQPIVGTGSGPYTAQITVPSGSIPTFTAGNHSITAVYNPGAGDNYASANSGTQSNPKILVQVVNQANSNSTASVTPTSEVYNTAGIPNAPVYGEQITFAATITPVAPATGAPTGFAYFTDGGTQFGPTIALVPGTNSSTVSITTSSQMPSGLVPSLGVGNHGQIVVHYLGDNNFQASNSTAFPAILISPAPTITALGTIPAAAQKYGTEFVLSGKVCAALVNGASPSLTTCASTPYPGFKGSMMFYDGGTLLNPGGVGIPVDANVGTASITITLASPPLQAAAVGTHNITAVYNVTGDPDFATSTSAPQALQVSQGPTTSTITSNVSAPVYGQPITFTATVMAPGSFGPLPTGTVTFMDGGLTLGTAPLAAVSGVATATFTVPNSINVPLTVGAHSIAMQYSGDSNYAASSTAAQPCTPSVSQGCALALTVGQATTATTLASNQNGSVSGQQVIFTATVAVVGPGQPVLSGANPGPGGTVTFWANYVAPTTPGGTPVGTVLGTGSLTRIGTGGTPLYQATLTLSTLPTSLVAVTAVYSGDANYASSASQALNQSISKLQSTVTLVSSNIQSTLGQPVTYTISVVPQQSNLQSPPVPTGTVSFMDGSNLLASLTLVGGQVTYTAALPVGGHLLSAAYTGDLNFQPSSSNAVNESVSKIQSTLNLTSSVPSGAVASQVITFTAQIQPTPPVGVAYPTGQIGFFMDGATQIGAASLASGVAALSTTLPAGNHQIQAFYVGDNNWTNAQSIYLAQVVGTATTTTQIVSSANPSVYGQAVVLTITVAVPYPGTVPANGTVQLYDGGNALGNPLPANNGTFSTTISNLAVGTHSIVAQFQANGSFSQSSSAALSQIVNKAPTTTTLAAFPNSSTSNESVTMTAVVTVPSPGSTANAAPSGTVQFVNTTTNSVLGSAPLTLVGGVWTATLNVTSLAQGSQSQLITATYSGDGNFATSTSTPQAQSVFGTEIAVVNAAGYATTNFAPNSFATIFGTNLAGSSLTANVTPWPSSLAGTTVTVTDSAGTARLAPLYYVSITQINFVIPANTAYGLANVTVTNASGQTASTIILITPTSPGLYSENASGQGVAAGYLLTVHADGTQSPQSPLFQYNPNTSQYVPVPITWANSTDQQYLVLYGTGIRGAAQSGVTATMNGISIPVLYAGAQAQFVGEDQINLGPIPTSLKGAGTVNIVITVNGQASNTVTVTIQ